MVMEGEGFGLDNSGKKRYGAACVSVLALLTVI